MMAAKNYTVKFELFKTEVTKEKCKNDIKKKKTKNGEGEVKCKKTRNDFKNDFYIINYI